MFQVEVSVVIPAYNASGLISKTIDSVISQDFEFWEIIVVDDCSTDDTASVIQEYQKKDKRIRYHCVKKNFGGPAGPRNIGVSLAKGKYISFLDADDIWHPKKLSTQLKVLLDSGCEFCSTSMKDFKDDELISHEENFSYVTKEVNFVGLRFRNRIPTSSVVIKRELLLAQPMKEDKAYQAVEDFDCWLKIHQKINRSIKIDYPLVNYRIVEGQISGSKTKQMKKVFGLHKNFPGSNIISPYLFTFTHVAGAVYYRLIKGGL